MKQNQTRVVSHSSVERRTSFIQRSAARAFTLIELLLVITIISILASLLMPALKRARDQGKSIQCMNGLRQIFLATTLYQQDNNERWPLYFDGSTGTWWFQSVFPNTNPAAGAWYLGPLTANTAHDPTWQLLHCPANTDTSWPGGWAGWQTINYCVNSVGGSAGKVPGAGGIDTTPNPANIPWMVDGKATYYDLSSLVSNYKLVHMGGANVLFFDGHAAHYLSPDLENVLFNNNPQW